ncbi:MAG TPA: YggT family protein [Acidimicrobiales bacterium]
MAEVICTLINIYVFVIIIRLFMSWVPPTPGTTYQQIYDGFVTVTEPVLAPVRGLLPPLNVGMTRLDLSPILVIFGLNILSRAICEGFGLF